jgi:hypothetical protein
LDLLIVRGLGAGGTHVNISNAKSCWPKDAPILSIKGAARAEAAQKVRSQFFSDNSLYFYSF